MYWIQDTETKGDGVMSTGEYDKYKMEQRYQERMNNDIQMIWDESIPFKETAKSIVQMFCRPVKSLRWLNFAGKIIVKYQVEQR